MAALTLARLLSTTLAGALATSPLGRSLCRSVGRSVARPFCRSVLRSSLILKLILKPLFASTVNYELAEAEGLNPDRAKAIFTILMAGIIAISIKMVGLLLITGMLIIPAAMARNISTSPQKMVIYSVFGGLLSVILGLFSSLEFNTSSGPSIIAAALFLFILSLLNIKQSIKLKN